MLLLLPWFVACRSLTDRAVKRNAEQTLELGRYCRSLAKGQHWSPDQVEGKQFTVGRHQTGGGIRYELSSGESRCDVEVAADGSISSVHYQPD